MSKLEVLELLLEQLKQTDSNSVIGQMVIADTEREIIQIVENN